LVSIGLVLSEEKIFEKVYDVCAERSCLNLNSKKEGDKLEVRRCFFLAHLTQRVR
jgi:hypothetical protein